MVLIFAPVTANVECASFLVKQTFKYGFVCVYSSKASHTCAGVDIFVVSFTIINLALRLELHLTCLKSSFG